MRRVVKRLLDRTVFLTGTNGLLGWGLYFLLVSVFGFSFIKAVIYGLVGEAVGVAWFKLAEGIHPYLVKKVEGLLEGVDG